MATGSQPASSARGHSLRLVRLLLRCGIAGALQIMPALPVKADDPHLGIIEYEISCLPCHGIDGRGSGPLAKSLAVAPADLTKIAKRHNGTFPVGEIAEIIDGRSAVASHGQRVMPVWGERYRATKETSESAEWIDKRVRAQISALVKYLATLQEK